VSISNIVCAYVIFDYLFYTRLTIVVEHLSGWNQTFELSTGAPESSDMNKISREVVVYQLTLLDLGRLSYEYWTVELNDTTGSVVVSFHRCEQEFSVNSKTQC